MTGARLTDAYSVDGLGPLARSRALAVRSHNAFLLEPIIDGSPDLLTLKHPVSILHRLEAISLLIVDVERVFLSWRHASSNV